MVVDFPPVFAELKTIMQAHASTLKVVEDSDTSYHLYSTLPYKGKPLFFGTVDIKKAYVAYHIVPLYYFPELLEGCSDALKKRMQGKSCFNFSKRDDALFAELADLTARALARYQAEKMA
jgi:hypothetical protein